MKRLTDSFFADVKNKWFCSGREDAISFIKEFLPKATENDIHQILEVARKVPCAPTEEQAVNKGL